MQNIDVQMPDNSTYEDMSLTITEIKTDILEKLKTHIKIESYIPPEFYRAFYKDTGRPRGVKLESFLWYLIF
jgi:hypothetical protein